MKNNVLERFDQIPYFTITGFKQVIEADESQSRLVREMLSRWVKRGHMIRLKNGVYMTRLFYERHQGDASFAPAMSAILVPQSYLSLEYVLQRAGVLTEVTYPITAVTLKNTRKIKNVLGIFEYRHIKSILYTGFENEKYYGVVYNQAKLSKAFFDYFYFHPLSRIMRGKQINLAEELRLNVEEFSPEVRDEFGYYVEKSGSRKMEFVLDNLRRTVWHP
jgi:predicted transcriptional regulator of viral defense system